MKPNPRHIKIFDDLIPQKEAERLFGVSDEFFRRKRKEGVITGVPLSNNRNWMYSKTELIAKLLPSITAL